MILPKLYKTVTFTGGACAQSARLSYGHLPEITLIGILVFFTDDIRVILNKCARVWPNYFPALSPKKAPVGQHMLHSKAPHCNTDCPGAD